MRSNFTRDSILNAPKTTRRFKEQSNKQLALGVTEGADTRKRRSINGPGSRVPSPGARGPCHFRNAPGRSGVIVVAALLEGPSKLEKIRGVAGGTVGRTLPEYYMRSWL